MNDKGRALRHELAGDDQTYLAPKTPHPIRRAASTGGLRQDLDFNTDDASSRAPSEIWGGDTKVREDDGRVDIDCDSKLARAIRFIHPAIKDEQREYPPPPSPPPRPPPPPYERIQGELSRQEPIKLNVLIQVVGSRGDIQPFVALGAELKRRGHFVRLATHDLFEKFVRDAGLEHYGVGGDPAALMAYMVKNPGLIPSMKSLQAGEVGKKRDMVEEMLDGFWEACIRPDTMTGEPFVADAIIANPPSFAHVHCAQALGIPVHLMFTMHWTSTEAFPHPLANLKNVVGDHGVANFVSYGVVEHLTWQGLGDVINKWRGRIDQDHVAMFDGPMLAETLKIPFTYCWSPALVPKPKDWGPHIGQFPFSPVVRYVCGFFFRDAPKYLPTDDLDHFLAAGPPPIYIGFGSIVLDDPEGVIHTILEAVRIVGVRAIVSKGWSNLVGSTSDSIYWIGDCPHEWLFQHVAAVIHHGGAGTTACGLRYGRPTTIVPFFGDQPFWGDMVANAGAGPRPILHKRLNAENLAEAIRYCLSTQAVTAARDIAAKMEAERGVEAAADSWWKQLPLEHIRCDLVPSQPAVWAYNKAKRPVRLSKVAAEVLMTYDVVQIKQLSVYSSNPITIDTTRWDPVSGSASAVMATTVDMAGSITGVVAKPIEKYHDEKRRRGKELGKQQDSGEIFPDGSFDDRLSITSASSGKAKGRKQSSMAGQVVGASAKSVRMIGTNAAKGMLVDVPLAITEGMRSVPKHFGTEVRDHGSVTDAKSGAVVAGRTFAWGFADGLSDFVMEPVRGASKEGAVGAFKGFGKGAASLVAKSGAGMFGLLAYPSAGIAKSLRSAVHSGTRKTIAKERLVEGQWLVKSHGHAALEVSSEEIIASFNRLRALR